MADFLMKPKIDFAFKENKNIKHKPGKNAQRRKTGYT